MWLKFSSDIEHRMARRMSPTGRGSGRLHRIRWFSNTVHYVLSKTISESIVKPRAHTCTHSWETVVLARTVASSSHKMDIIINSYSKMSYQGVERQKEGGGVLSATGISQEKMAISEFQQTDWKDLDQNRPEKWLQSPFVVSTKGLKSHFTTVGTRCGKKSTRSRVETTATHKKH